MCSNSEHREVQLVSSNAYVVDQPGMLGVHVGMSQLVANMLESVLNLWQLRIPAEEVGYIVVIGRINYHIFL